VGERHVARAERVEHAQRAERVVDRVAALHADHRGDAAGLERALDVSGGVGNLEDRRPLLRHAMDHVDLLHRHARRFLAHHRRGRIHRPELPADAALPQARNIGHQLGNGFGDVGFAEVLAGIEIAQRPWIVVVPVDQRRRFVKRSCPC